jgi:2-oxo-4-hydroxy-4-carboxy-5-ureidoimidazoline decarboxylase
MTSTPDSTPPSAAALSAFSQSDFTDYLGAVYEHSPWVAQRAWLARPFHNRAALAQAMSDALMQSSAAEQLALIRAHPELTGKAGVRTDLTADSSREQRGAGLDQCTPEEYARLRELNARYRERCGFPFILAVAGRNRQQIIANLAQRVENDVEAEFRDALAQIVSIAGFRLQQLVSD